MSPGPAIEIEGLSKRFGAFTALDRVTWAAPPGQAVVLWGANGAGKTTLLRCLLGILPCEGTLRVLQHDVRRAGVQVRQLVGYVPQEPGLAADPTVFETASFYARLRRVPDARVRELLEAWELGAAAGQPVGSLSGGMKQKLAIVIALLSRPPVLLLDEPTSHLDLHARLALASLLGTLKADGTTLVLCSHRAGEVLKLADRVLILEQGRVTADGTPQELEARLQDAKLLGVTVPPELKARAAQVLARQGLTVHLNGTAIWIAVAPGRMMEPLALLAEAKIPVTDLEIERARPEGPGPGGR